MKKKGPLKRGCSHPVPLIPSTKTLKSGIPLISMLSAFGDSRERHLNFGNRSIQFPCKRLSRWLNLVNILHIKSKKNLIRESFSLALSYFLSTTETRVQSEEVYLTLIRYPTIASQYKLHYQPRSQGSLLPVPTERETGRVEENPGNEVTPFPIFFPQTSRIPIVFTSVSYPSTPW